MDAVTQADVTGALTGALSGVAGQAGDVMVAVLPIAAGVFAVIYGGKLGFKVVKGFLNKA